LVFNLEDSALTLARRL